MGEIIREEAIRRIKEVYHAEVDLENENFGVYDQLLVYESIQESEEEEIVRNGFPPPTQEENITVSKESVNVKWNGNDTYKRSVNSKLTESKREAIAKLLQCDYRTPPRQIALLLEELFIDHKSKEGHWLYIAQSWPPRVINRVIHRINKQHRTGEQTIKNPAAYFTHLIKFRKKRRRERAHGI
jgi:hypothetical protein